MKQFFKFMLASMVGVFLAFVVLFFVLLGMLASVAALAKREEVVIESNTVLHLKLNQQIADRSTENPFEDFGFGGLQGISTFGLNDILKNIRKAQNDPNIAGIFLDLNTVQAGWATLGEIKAALDTFSTSGKFVVAYSETLTQKAFYLAASAEQIFLNPAGMIDFRGLNTQLVFFKNMLDNLGIEPQVIRHGKFKSAAEPFFLERMSPENREQISSYVNSIWGEILGDISEDKELTVEHLNQVADGFFTRNAALALEWQMIDSIKHRDEVYVELSRRLGIENPEDIEFVTLQRYSRVAEPTRIPRSRNKIAVVYGSGAIISGRGSDQQMGSDPIAAAIREARLDTAVKAIVFRVNSPGGSALASEVIHREVKLASKVKPVIVSMGDVAASGGYYVATHATKIIANPTTITGSIGVFGLIPNMQNFFNRELGITFDNVKTNRYSDLITINRPLTASEKRLIQDQVESVYDTFVGHVADGREMRVSLVDSLGQGRVYSGVEAKQLGLVDKLGGLNIAIQQAAEEANLADFRIVELPARRDFFTMLTEGFATMQETALRNKLGSAYHYYRQVRNVSEISGILTRMPFDVIID
ncbi:MAG TPA: signal peptide peptidase SppA [Bacteroidales bacterium]|nr:signal peptide peptidase SppA [Bacteroidales bacterium]